MKRILSWIRLYRNWHVRLANHRIIGGGRKITLVLRNGTRFRIVSGTNDDGMLEEIYAKKAYFPEGFGVREGDVVIDIGAQKGFFSVLSGSVGARVFSFEPEPGNFGFLKENITLNGLGNVKAFNLAVCGKPGKRRLSIDGGNTGGHSMFTETGESIEIKCTTLGKIIEKNRIGRVDLLKLDCEGAEYEILFGMRKNMLSRIERIVMEHHDIGRFSAKDMERFLQKNGYDVTTSGSYLYARKITGKPRESI